MQAAVAAAGGRIDCLLQLSTAAQSGSLNLTEIKMKAPLKYQTTLLKAVYICILFLISSLTQATPNASFTANQRNGCSPLEVEFTNTSTGAVSYYWDLGNGNTSTLANPTNLYTTSGSFTVMLVAIDAGGARDTATYINYISVAGRPSANFFANTTNGCPDNNSITFINTSTGGSTYLWDFGDGNLSTSQSPTHHYVLSGTFTVTLIVTNSAGCTGQEIREEYITINPKPEAIIEVSDTSSCDPSTVFNFSCPSTGITSWYWIFGDGNTSTSQNPSHQYAAGGNYNVKLIVTNAFGCRDTSDIKVIHVGSATWVSFITYMTSGCTPYTVTLSCTTPNVVSWFWDFGDGYTTTAGMPTHVYTVPGVYTVTLTVTTSTGCTGVGIRNNYITVGGTPTVDFSYSATQGCSPFTVQFTNLSTNYDSCYWNFGDGYSSTQPNPSHTYTGIGTFNVSLECWNGSGCRKTKTINNAISVSRAKALFNATPRVGCPPLTVNFSNYSVGNGLTYFWDFGDGNTSTQQTPSHTYTTSGSFNVKLIVTDSAGCSDTLYKPGYVQTINPVANYTPPPPTYGCAPMTTQFTDNTIGTISWFWNFGDGDTSTQQNPIHTYDEPGTYVVSLTTVSSGGGCSQTISNFSTFIVRGGYAGFTHTDSDCPPYESCFLDTSSNAVSWLWDFGDGQYSTQQNPCHNYASPGYHSVSLTITTADGCVYSTMQSNTVYFTPFGANFYGIPQGSSYPLQVDFFANATGATGWYWEFGDGNTSTLENPSNVYQDSGDYTVTLTIYNDLCTLTYVHPPFQMGLPDTSGIDVGNQGEPDPQRGCAPLNVGFSQTIPGSVAWHWDFGDGDTSNLQFPHHLYTIPGIYTVTLTTWDTLNLESELVLDSMVQVYGPYADFGFIQQAACSNTQIALLDSSLNAYTWSWNFGDGNYSSQQNPTHTYTSNYPNYIVTLTVADTVGCVSSLSTSIFANFVSPFIVSETEICGYDTVHFATSLQGYTSYFWDFGDGNTSTEENPTHLYTTEGEFPASLTVTDASGCSQTVAINPNISVRLPHAQFTLNDHQNCDTLNAIFTNTSQNAEGYFWTFGDGMTSTLENPIHTYGPGVYDVTLTIYDGGCIDTFSMPQAVKVDTAHVDFDKVIESNCIPMVVHYTDLSINAASWHWKFGVALQDTSTLQNPTVIYDPGPTSGITLSIIDVNGCRDSITKGPPVPTRASFTNSIDSGCVPVTVHFQSTTNTAYGGVFWDFGDGFTSTLPNPVHTYTVPGDYDVMQIAYSGPNFGNCADTLIKPAKIKAHEPRANFSTPDVYACAPSLVQFVDSSFHADSYLWDFGDSSTSTSPSPSHIYTTPGIYTVSLIATSNMGCADTLERPLYITVLGPVTHFSSTPTEGCAPFTVNFTDESLNAIDWSWNFGDGYSAITTDASHTFNDTGTFTVTLVTHDTAGCSAYYELPQKVKIHATPVAGFTNPNTTACMGAAVPFTNTSVDAQSYLWNFGDGNTSTDVNPIHTYNTPGAYYPSLIVSTPFGCWDSITAAAPIVILATPQVSITPDVTEGCSPLFATFTSSSSYIDNAIWYWDFGYGITSIQTNPTIVLTTPGIYTGLVVITNANGCSDSVLLPPIEVQDSLPPPESKILAVSVVNNTSVEITWENNTAVDLEAYVLYRLNTTNNQYEVIHTDTNLNNTTFSLNPTYIDTGLNTLQNVYTYKVQAWDACSNTIPLNMLTAHSTINVESQRQGTGILVNWNPYGGCGVNSYRIYRTRADGGQPSWQYLTDVPPSTLNYLDTTFDCPYSYAYRITATDLCGNPYISNSDTDITVPENIYENQVVDMVRSTVVDNQTVLTEWLPPVVHPEAVVQYDLFRSTDNIHFSFLTSISPAQTDYLDNNVDVQSQHYYYKIQVQNRCDIAEDLSGNTSSILLKGKQDDDYIVNLQWSPYLGWNTGVDYYIIERKDDGGDWQFFKKVDGDTLNYSYRD
jgi:PKD repeat protein